MISGATSNRALSRCIFCLHQHTGDRSLEHVFQDAIGGTFKVRLPCEGCNNGMGHRLDHRLTDDLRIKLCRHKLGFAAADEPDPLLSRDGLLEDGTKVRTDASKQDGITIRSYPAIERGNDEAGNPTIQIRADANDMQAVRKALQRWRRDNGYPEFTEEELASIIAQGTHTQQQAKVNYQVRLSHELDPRPFVKIAYELACYWFGENYLRQEPEARKIRRYLRDKNRDLQLEEDLMIRVAEEAPPNLPWLPAPIFPPDAHYATATGRPEGLFAIVVIYGQYTGCVRLSRTVPIGIGAGRVVVNRHGEPAIESTLQDYIGKYVIAHGLANPGQSYN